MTTSGGKLSKFLRLKQAIRKYFYKQHVPYQHPNFKTKIYSCFICHRSEEIDKIFV